MIAAGPLWIIASVVVVASGWKLANPAPTARAIGALVGASVATRRAGSGPLVIAARALGFGEAALALFAVWRGGAAALVLAGLYLAFALIAWRLQRRNIACGCFGAASTKTSGIHIAVNAAAAAVATWAAAIDVPGLRAAFRDLPAFGIGHLVLVSAGAAAMIALLTVLPAVRELSRTRPGVDQPVLFRLRSELT